MRRIPAYGVAVVMIGYAVGKAVFAVEGRLGFPSGPIVPPEAAEAYFLNPALAQAFAAISGLAGAALALATVSPFGRRVPRKLLLAGVLLLAIGVGAGAVVMVLDGFVGLGIGWQWYHGVAGLVVLGLLAALAHGSLRADAGRDHAADAERLQERGGLAEQ
ncbi:hypothetical protein ACWEOO_17785 [Kribbella sp. NPDC004138]